MAGLWHGGLELKVRNITATSAIVIAVFSDERFQELSDSPLDRDSYSSLVFVCGSIWRSYQKLRIEMWSVLGLKLSVVRL